MENSLSQAERDGFALALRQIGDRLNNDEKRRLSDFNMIQVRFNAIDDTMRANRTEVRTALDGFGAQLVKAVDQMKECGKLDHARIEQKVDAHAEKIAAHDDLLDGLAVTAAEKRGQSAFMLGALRVGKLAFEAIGSSVPKLAIGSFLAGILAVSVKMIAWAVSPATPGVAAAPYGLQQFAQVAPSAVAPIPPGDRSADYLRGRSD